MRETITSLSVAAVGIVALHVFVCWPTKQPRIRRFKKIGRNVYQMVAA